jgi:hypothetical protein
LLEPLAIATVDLDQLSHAGTAMAGRLDEKALKQTSDYIVISVLSPGGSQWWAETSMVWPELREYIDGRLAEGDAGMLPINEALLYWMSMVANKPPL